MGSSPKVEGEIVGRPLGSLLGQSLAWPGLTEIFIRIAHLDDKGGTFSPTVLSIYIVGSSLLGGSGWAKRGASEGEEAAAAPSTQ